MRFIFIILCILLKGLGSIEAYGPFDIGICYTEFDPSFPYPRISDTMNVIKNLNVTKIRFYHPTPDAVEVLRGTEISVTVGVKNEDLPSLARSADAAKLWIEKNIQPYKDNVVFSLIVLGDNAVPGELSKYILDAMVNLQGVINDDASIKAIKVTTAVNVSVLVPSSYLPTSHLPSESEFSEESMAYMLPIVKFLSMQSAPLMINILPDDQCWQYKQNCSLDFATFQAKLPVFHDHSLGYKNLFETMVDSFYWAMEKAGCPNVDVAVTSGWSSYSRYPLGQKDNAYNYNYNYMQQCSLGGGTPKKPNAYLEGYIYQFFDGTEFDRDDATYGLFNFQFKSMYDLFTAPPPPPFPPPPPY